MNIIIRKMTVEDISAVVALDQMSFSLPWPERSFRFELTNNPASRCWVAEVDGRLIGMIVNWLLVDEVHVATLAIHPDFRRQGIAKKLLTHSLRYMIGEGAISSFLEVRESNIAAQEMYRRFGYVDRLRRYYGCDERDLMTLENLKIECEVDSGEIT
jgi:ribosomal-protein-alanine N-acetyltransferase